MKKLTIMFFVGMFCLAPAFSAGCTDFFNANFEEQEEKIYTVVNIDDDFDDGSVLVVMKKWASQFDRVYEPEFFGYENIESVEDLTRFIDPDNAKYLDKEKFHKILKLNLKEKSKEKVVEAVNVLQKLKSVLSVEPNYIFSGD
ncbi:MAG: hypothetical protein IJU84_06080 [Clostridia bacterium]|nr:hypothetical protein [Clostridia bacterium]